MANLRKDLEEALDEGERIEAVVIGEHDSDPNKYNDEPAHHADKLNRVLTWEEAAPILDEEYDSSYGSAECWPFYAWTNTHVYFVCEYDGSTRISAIPRNPQDIAPDFQ